MASKEFWSETFDAIERLSDEEFNSIVESCGYNEMPVSYEVVVKPLAPVYPAITHAYSYSPTLRSATILISKSADSDSRGRMRLNMQNSGADAA